VSTLTIALYVYLLGGIAFGIFAIAFGRNRPPFGSEEPILFWLSLLVWPVPAFFLGIRGSRPKRDGLQSNSVPPVSSDELSRFIGALLPDAEISLAFVSKEHRSWVMAVTNDNLKIEFFWGPLSGFGVTDLLAKDDDPDIFRPYGVALESIDEAKRWFSKRVAGA